MNIPGIMEAATDPTYRTLKNDAGKTGILNDWVGTR